MRLAHTACGLFQQHGSPESGVGVLDKAAKILEATQPRQALELFTRAVDITIVSNHLTQAKQYFKITSQTCTKYILLSS